MKAKNNKSGEDHSEEWELNLDWDIQLPDWEMELPEWDIDSTKWDIQLPDWGIDIPDFDNIKKGAESPEINGEKKDN
jgi:hypothetical protein